MSKRSNFKRISSKRVLKIKSDLLRLSNFNNTQYYEFTEDDIKDIYRDLKGTLDLVFCSLFLHKKGNFKL